MESLASKALQTASWFKSSKLVRIAIMSLSLAASSAFTLWFYDRYGLKSIPRPAYRLPTSFIENGKLVIRIPGRHLVGELVRYQKKVKCRRVAYLMFDYLRSRPSLAHREFLLTNTLHDGKITYSLKQVLPNDFISVLQLVTGE